MAEWEPSALLEEFRKIGDSLRERGPFLQTIGVYDCEATREHAVRLDYGADVGEVLRMFKAEAAPVIRWFFDKDQKVVAVNKRGFALVISKRTLDSAFPPSDRRRGEPPLFGPRVDYLR